MRKKAKKPRQKDRADSETRLLDAAKKIFSEKGFSATTTRMIALKSGVNLALITRYFKNKEGLFTAVLERDLRDHGKEELQYEPQTTLEAECLAYIEAEYRKVTVDLAYYRIIMGQFITDPKAFKRLREDIVADSRTAAFESRLAPHFTALGISDKKKIRQFAERIDLNVHANILFDIVIFGMPLEAALKDVRDFVKIYCAGLTANRKET